MRQLLFPSLTCLGLCNLILAGAIAAQPSESIAPLRLEAPFDLGAPRGADAIALDPGDGSIVVGGSRVLKGGSCGPAARAFVTRLTEDGSELWRRGADGLLAELTGIDPQHVLASAVHGLAVDPLTGEIVAVGEALVGWQGGGCETGVTTARGTLVLKLASDGTLVHDAYLGVRPDGPPPAAADCGALCLPGGLLQEAGRAVAVDADGEVVVTSRRSVGKASAMLAEGRLFVRRLGTDLSLQGYLDVEPSPAKTIVSTVCADLPASSTVLTPLLGTTFIGDDDPALVAAEEGCKLQFGHDDNQGDPGAVNFGVMASFNVSLPSSGILWIHLVLRHPDQPMMELYLRKNGENVKIATLGNNYWNGAGKLVASVQVPDPATDYIIGGRLVAILEVPTNDIQNCRNGKLDYWDCG